MALSSGVGSETQRPFALVVVGGMLTTLVVALWMLPTIYSYITTETTDHAGGNGRTSGGSNHERSIVSQFIFLHCVGNRGSFARAQDQNAAPPRTPDAAGPAAARGRAQSQARRRTSGNRLQQRRSASPPARCPIPRCLTGVSSHPAARARCSRAPASSRQPLDFPLLIGGQRGARIEAADQGLLASPRPCRFGRRRTGAACRGAFRRTSGGAGKNHGVAGVARRHQARSRDRFRPAGSGMASRYDLARVEVELAGVTVRMDEAARRPG